MVDVQLKTPEDVHAYVQSLGQRRVEDDPSVKAWRIAKQTTYLYVLVASFLVYFLIDAINEALSLPAVNFAVVIKPAPRGDGIAHPQGKSGGYR
jgi:hypothetical protein